MSKAKALKFTASIVPFASLTFDKKHQARAALNKEVLENYTDLAVEAKTKGADSPFPDLRAIKRNGEILVFSGFHRGSALKKAKYEETKVAIAESEEITDSEILRLAIKENAEHGIPASNADKLHNLLALLKDKANHDLSNVALAEIAGCSEAFVREHRPVAAKGKQVKGKDGRVIKTGKIGKAKKKKLKEKLDAEAGEEEEIPDVSGTVGGNNGKPKAEKADDAERSLNRVATILAAADPKFKAKAFKEAVVAGTLGLSANDLTFWASRTDSQIVRISKLVIEGRWRPRAALTFIEKVVTPKTKVEELHNLAIAGGGVIRNPSNNAKFGESVEGADSLKVIVWDDTKFEVTVTPR